MLLGPSLQKVCKCSQEYFSRGREGPMQDRFGIFGISFECIGSKEPNKSIEGMRASAT